MDKNELADLIETFVNDKGGIWSWDDFVSIKQTDPEIEEIRRLCVNLPTKLPPIHPEEYCGKEGIVLLQSYAQKLRLKNEPTRQP